MLGIDTLTGAEFWRVSFGAAGTLLSAWLFVEALRDWWIVRQNGLAYIGQVSAWGEFGVLAAQTIWFLIALSVADSPPSMSIRPVHLPTLSFAELAIVPSVALMGASVSRFLARRRVWRDYQ